MVNRSEQNKEMGRRVAQTLLEINAIKFRPTNPFKLTAGWASPVYIDCRKIISHLEQRRIIIENAVSYIEQELDNSTEMIAGGETAGIPFAAWISDKLSLPMLYVRKKSKGFGQMGQIEGDMPNNSHVLLVEDLATDGQSKINFVEALRKGGANVTDLFVIFYYGVFPGADETMDELGTKLHYLCDWWDVLKMAKKGNYFSTNEVDEVNVFLDDPLSWSAANGGR